MFYIARATLVGFPLQEMFADEIPVPVAVSGCRTIAVVCSLEWDAKWNLSTDLQMVNTSADLQGLTIVTLRILNIFKAFKIGGACGILWRLVSLACQRSPRRGPKMTQGILARNSCAAVSK